MGLGPYTISVTHTSNGEMKVRMIHDPCGPQGLILESEMVWLISMPVTTFKECSSVIKVGYY